MPWDMWCCLVFVLLFMVTLLLTVILTVLHILRYKVTDSFYSIRAATLKKTTQCQTAPLSTRQSVEKELNQYLRTLEACPQTNPLDWWKQHEAHFPLLAKLAKKIPVYSCHKCTLRAGIQYKWKHCNMSKVCT